MLCNLCDSDIADGDYLNCSMCNAILHFGCATLTETDFRKMPKVAKENWCCSKCNLNEQCAEVQASTALVHSNVHNETIQNLIASINFMSNTFDSLSKQMQVLFTTVNDNKDENRNLKEENIKQKYGNRISMYEQKAIGNSVEIVDVPETYEEKYAKPAKSIATSAGVNICVLKAFHDQSNGENGFRKRAAELLQSRHNKETMMESVNKSKLTGKVVNPNWNGNKMYIKNCLPYLNKNVFFKTRTLAIAKQNIHMHGLTI